MHNQGSLVDPRQRSVAVCRRNGAPFSNRRQLSACGLHGYWPVAIRGATLQPFDISSPRGFAGLTRSEERGHEQSRWIGQQVGRELGEGHAFSTSWARPHQDHPPDHVRIFKCQLLRDHAAEREPHDVNVSEIERAAKFGTVLVIAATVDGVSPLEPPTPALSNSMTSRSAAKPFVTLVSQLSMFAAK